MTASRTRRAAAAPLAATARVIRMRRRPKVDGSTRLDFVDHLGDLRGRLLIASITILVAFIGAFIVHGRIIEALTSPLNGVPPVTLGVAEPFMTAVRVSFMTAVAISLPVLLWQLWGFVAPACKDATRKTVALFVTAGSVLFVGGVAFGYWFALPQAVGFLTQFDAHLYDTQVRAADYLTFAAAVLLSVGLVFQLPIALLALVRFRILSHGTLKKHRRIAYVLLAALAVALPGVDPVTTTMWLVPLFFLYEGTVLIAGRYEKRLAKAGMATETMLDRKITARAERKAAEEAEIEDAEILEFRRTIGLTDD